jgi:UDP-2-acetamido-3-amino-2,3-dideoxy-glucuronate N-acetyltransferase
MPILRVVRVNFKEESTRDESICEEGPQTEVTSLSLQGFEDYRSPLANIHPLAFIESPCRLGDHTTVHPFTRIMGHTMVGNACQIGHNVTIAPGVIVGNRVRVYNACHLNTGVILEDEVQFGPNAVVVPMRRIRATSTGTISQISPTLIKNGAMVGPNVTIGAGLTVGSYAFIEAGTVVDHHVPDFALVSGNPLQLLGWRCACGKALTLPSLDHNTVLLPQHDDSLALPVADNDSTVTCGYCDRQYAQKTSRRIVLKTVVASSLDATGLLVKRHQASS